MSNRVTTITKSAVSCWSCMTDSLYYFYFTFKAYSPTFNYALICCEGFHFIEQNWSLNDFRTKAEDFRNERISRTVIKLLAIKLLFYLWQSRIWPNSHFFWAASAAKLLYPVTPMHTHRMCMADVEKVALWLEEWWDLLIRIWPEPEIKKNPWTQCVAT